MSASPWLRVALLGSIAGLVSAAPPALPGAADPARSAAENAAPSGAAAGDAPRPLDLFALGAPTFTTFTAGDGVPEAAIVALATDAEGFVWLASPGGLARYDGHRWEPVAAPQIAGQARDLFLDHERTLWAPLYDRGLGRYDGRSWGLEDFGAGNETVHIRRVAETEDLEGHVTTWGLSLDSRLFRRIGGRWQAEPGNSELPNGMLISLARTREIGGRERLWVATFNEGVWYREDGGSWRHFRAPGFDPSQVEDLLVTRSGGREELWVATFGLGLFRLTEAGLTAWTLESGDLASNQLYRLKATSLPNGERVVWAATRSGLVRVHGDKAQVFDRRHGLPSNVVRNLHVWRSPSGVDVLWIATEGGVARTVVGATSWQIASLMGARSIGVFGVLVEPDGKGGERLWVASTQDGLGLYEDKHWRTFGPATGELPATDFRLVVRERDEAGRPVLWVGSTGGDLFRVEEGPRFVTVPTPWDKHAGQAVMDLLARTVDGRYERWIATRQSGIHRWSEGRWTAFRPDAVVGQWRIVKLLEQIDREGRSWLWASSNQGLARFDGKQWTLLGRDAGLPDVELTGLTLIPDRDGRAVLWAGSARSGIIRVDVSNPRTPRVLQSADLPKPPDPAVYGAQQDSKGRIYIATNNGVQQLVPNPAGGFRERVFGRRDGMVHEECNTNAQRIDAHDRFWTGTLGGLAVYEPEGEVPDREPKPLRLTRVQIDGAEIGPGAVRLSPGSRELRVDFALLAWHREADSRFRSQLVGYEPEPGAWGRETNRVFGALPPGGYVLRVEARDYAGVASPPLEIPVEVLPAWWQRLWVRIVGLVLFAVAGPLFYLFRVRLLSRQKAELERLVASRTTELAAASERLAQLSREDALTGVANRRRLDEVLDEEWRRAVRGRTPLSFLLLDVDHFKAYNDRLGHQAGDECLRVVARAVASAHTRAGELVARYGGEEFAVLLPGVALDGARVSAENVRRCVAELALSHPSSSASPVVTVSIGVASVLPTASASPADLVGAADRALYQAKNDGRNCVRG